MNISVIGCGYVGLVTAACLVEMGHTVAATDNDYAKLPLLRQGLSPIYEEHLAQLLQLGFESKSLAIKL
jgi:UDPglucose 6-dehydrogenase